MINLKSITILHCYIFLCLINIFSLDYNTKIVIFCYHRFNVKDNKYSIKKGQLEKHIKTALNKGFNIISEKELFDFYYNDYKLPPLNLLITIDDGFKESYSVTLDILEKYNAKSLILINTAMIDNKEFLSWKQILKLNKHGIAFGNHSANHFNYHSYLKKNNKTISNLLKSEIIDSDNITHKKIGKESISYAHPYGIFDDRVMSVVKEKYKLVYTTNKGPNSFESDPLYLRRYVIDVYSNIEKYLDYELLPIVKTEPNNGGYLNKNGEISFYFENEKELNRFSNFYFLTGRKKIKANIDKNRVFLKFSNTKIQTITISLLATDKYGDEYIETITINNLKK